MSKSRKRPSRRKRRSTLSKPICGKPVDIASKRLCNLGVSFLKFCVGNVLFQSFPDSSEGTLTFKYKNELPVIQTKLENYSKGNLQCSFAFIGSFLILNGVKLTSMFIKNFISSDCKTDAKLKQYDLSIWTICSNFYGYHFHNVEAKIGYKFQNRALLLQAFTDESHEFVSQYGTYQRLEFLGDAVLEYLIVRYLFNHPSKLDHVKIAQLRASITSNETFANLVFKYGLETFIFGKTEDWKHKQYGDIFESLAAAVYIDSGMDLDVVWNIFSKLMNDLITF